MKLFITLLLSLSVGIFCAQTEHCPPQGESLCFGGDYYPITIHSTVKIYFDTGDPYNVTQCTVVFLDETYTVPVTVLKIKEKKYNYKVVASLKHPRLEPMSKFVFFFSKY